MLLPCECLSNPSSSRICTTFTWAFIKSTLFYIKKAFILPISLRKHICCDTACYCHVSTEHLLSSPLYSKHCSSAISTSFNKLHHDAYLDAYLNGTLWSLQCQQNVDRCACYHISNTSSPLWSFLCQGDLCNSSRQLTTTSWILPLAILASWLASLK